MRGAEIRSDMGPLVFDALSMVKIWGQPDLRFSRSGKAKTEGEGPLKRVGRRLSRTLE